MEDLRLTFLIFGIVAIIAILVHGMWTIRKNAKGNEKAKFESRDWQNKSDPSLGDDDSFDAHGVGSVRVISSKKTVDNGDDERHTRRNDNHESAFSKDYDGDELSSLSSDENNNTHSDDQHDADKPNPECQQDVKTELELNDDKDITVTNNSENVVSSKNERAKGLSLDDDLSLERSEMDFAKLAEEHEQTAPKLYGSVVTQPKPAFQRASKATETSHRQAPNQDNPHIPEPPPFLLKSAAANPEVNPQANKIADIEAKTERDAELQNKADARGRVEPEFKLDSEEQPPAEPAKTISLAAQARKLVSRRKKSVADVIRREPEMQATKKLNEEQMRIDFSNEEPARASFESNAASSNQPSALGKAPTTTQNPTSSTQSTSSSAASSAKQDEQATDVLVLNVRAPDDREITGAALLPMLLTLGLKFGEQDIFHRHVNTNGKGPVLFSLANLFKPGVFDIDSIETFSTRGLSLFMMLPIEGDAQQVFNMMHNAARKLADEFGCQILDGSRGVLTKQGLQKYSERIREFERRRINR
jgi:cell division protein ZipA